MITYLVQIMAGITLALGALVGAGMLALYQQKRSLQSGVKRPRRFPGLTIQMNALLTKIEGTIREQGTSQGIVAAYGLLRSEIVNLDIEPPKGSTEREFVQFLGSHSYFFEYRSNLSSIYGVYEKARFGVKQLTEDEATQFVREVQRLLTHLSQLTVGSE